MYNRFQPVVSRMAPSMSGDRTSVEAACDSRLFEALFEHALDAVLVVDDERRYVEANPAACELIGLPRESIAGRRVEDFFEVVGNRSVPDAWAAFQRQGTETGVCCVRRPDGSFRYAGFRAKANFAPGLHLSILRDITDQRAADHALRDAIKELERSNEELSYFAYTVAHNLASSLRAISSHSHLLRAKAVASDPSLVESVAGIEHAIGGVNAFLEDLLTFAQVGRSGQSCSVIDTEAVFHFALASLRSSIEEAHATISHDPLPQVYANERQIMELFQNLIDNSLKYRGSAPPRIRVEAARNADEWLFSVSDNGIGIAADRQASIFEMFKRLHGREIRGTGLGLALCKRIVESCGGRLWVESEPGKGSTFRFTLPGVPDEAALGA
jgi:PAS domain S-box-containing protein